jgi:FkbM family methyltransferase
VPASDPSAATHQRCASKEARRCRRAEFYQQFLCSGALAFDIGASTGSRTELLLGVGARVVCVEPMDACFEALRNKFENNPNVILVPRGVAAQEGECPLFYGDEALTTASMSREWIEAVRDTERLRRHPSIHWRETKMVRVTTLDRLIEEFGEPRFCKIDVEGFELEVLRGLSRPLHVFSFEYTPERIAPSLECVRHIASLGRYCFNYSEGESFLLSLDHWVCAKEILDILPSLTKRTIHGDILARMDG